MTVLFLRERDRTVTRSRAKSLSNAFFYLAHRLGDDLFGVRKMDEYEPGPYDHQGGTAAVAKGGTTNSDDRHTHRLQC